MFFTSRKRIKNLSGNSKKKIAYLSKFSLADTSESVVSEKKEKNFSESIFLSILLAFGGGLLTSLTPCIFPMLPITLGVIGAKNNQSKIDSFLLSFVYVLGIALTYSLLGLTAAMTGTLFGSLLQNPVVIVSVSLIFLVLGFSMFDVISVQIPSSIQTKLAKFYQNQNKNYLGVALMGVISGMIATPCVGPVIVGLLTFVAKTGNLFLGFWLLFSFAMGMGTILILLGTFSNIILNLPKAGNWMEKVKKGIGIGLFFVSFYYLKPVIESGTFALILGAFMVLLGVMLDLFKISEKDLAFSEKLSKSFAIIVIASGLYFFISGLEAKKIISLDQVEKNEKSSLEKKEEISWLNDEEKALQIALNEGKMVIIDFYADWCPACIEFDKYTYKDKRVIKELEDFVTLKIDATNISPEIENLFKKYEIVGLPAIIFLDREGKIIKEYTVNGFLEADAFLKIISEIKKIKTASL